MDVTFVEFSGPGTVRTAMEPWHGDGPGASEVVVRTETSIISAGTELAALHAKEPGHTFPFRPGYGCIGRIEALGEDVTGFAVGDRVFYAGKHASRQRFPHNAGHQWGHLFPVPEGLDPVEAVVGCMAEIAMTAPEVTELRLGDTVAVFGLGMVGILAALLYQFEGARVIGLDPVPARAALARRAGVETVVDAPPDGQREALRALTGDTGPSICVDAAGHAAVVAQCVASAGLFGQVVLLGTPRAPYPTDAQPPWHAVHVKGLVVRGAHMWRYPVSPVRGGLSVEGIFATVFGLIASRRLDVRPLVSHVIRPEEALAAYAGLENDPAHYSGVVIDWHQS